MPLCSTKGIFPATISSHPIQKPQFLSLQDSHTTVELLPFLSGFLTSRYGHHPITFKPTGLFLHHICQLLFCGQMNSMWTWDTGAGIATRCSCPLHSASSALGNLLHCSNRRLQLYTSVAGDGLPCSQECEIGTHGGGGERERERERESLGCMEPEQFAARHI